MPKWIKDLVGGGSDDKLRVLLHRPMQWGVYTTAGAHKTHEASLTLHTATPRPLCPKFLPPGSITPEVVMELVDGGSGDKLRVLLHRPMQWGVYNSRSTQNPQGKPHSAL